MVCQGVESEGNIGAKDSPGSKIYLNAQTWAVLADVAEGCVSPRCWRRWIPWSRISVSR